MKTSIAFRLKLILLMSAAIALLVGFIGMVSVKNLESLLKQEGDVTIPAVQTLDKIVAQTLRLRVHILNHALHAGSPEQQDIEKAITKSRAVLWEQIARYDTLTVDDKDRELLAADKAAVRALETSFDPVIEASNRGDGRETQTRINAFVKASSDTKATLDAHISYLAERIEQSQAQAAAMSTRTSIESAIVIVLGVCLAAILGMLLTRSISRQIDEIKASLAEIADHGDFRIRVPVRGGDELSEMGNSLNGLIASLQSSLKQIAENSHLVAQKSHDMSESAHQVAEASAQQSDSASGMAAAVEQMTVSVGQIGERAAEADQHANDAGRLALSGGEIIGHTVQDIHEIAETVSAASEQLQAVGRESDKITSVVAVIREVADQTNLLALNAAIEAARAGEQGRGFAVVADEVRKLAERTANSTREISAIIEGIRGGTKEAVSTMSAAVDRVSGGVTRAKTANAAINQIAGASSKAREMVSEISGAIREQSAASTSIAQQIERIAQMAEISSQSAVSSSRAAHELDALAASMLKVVQHYHI